MSAGPVPLEFHGWMQDGQGMKFRLYDPARKVGAWVALNQRDETTGVQVMRYDAPVVFHGGSSAEQLVVEYQGRELTLTPRESHVVAAAPHAPLPPAVAVHAPTLPVVSGRAPTAAESTASLNKVAEELARRRELREAAARGGKAALPAAPGGMPPKAMTRD